MSQATRKKKEPTKTSRSASAGGTTGRKGKRRYTMRRRAERQQETRRRIVDAAMELHEELGPKTTTISAIADRAGVQRLTVYRHFPDEADLFRACTSTWIGLNPPPEPGTWRHALPGADRTRTALSALYVYFRKTEGMWAAAFRDRDEVPALREPMAEFDGYLDAVRDELLEGWESTDDGKSGRHAAVLGHAVRFSTWRSLRDEGLAEPAMAGLVVRWLEAL